MAVMGQIRGGNGSGGGSITKDQLNVAGKTAITSITTRGASVSVTQDCVLAGIISTSSSSNSAKVFLDGSELVYTNNTLGIGTTDGTNFNSYGIFIPNGVTLTTRDHTSTSYNLKLFPLN